MSKKKSFRSDTTTTRINENVSLDLIYLFYLIQILTFYFYNWI